MYAYRLCSSTFNPAGTIVCNKGSDLAQSSQKFSASITFDDSNNTPGSFVSSGQSLRPGECVDWTFDTRQSNTAYFPQQNDVECIGNPGDVVTVSRCSIDVIQ
jgi:hypothetical protein